jgi:hypothetical protein
MMARLDQMADLRCRLAERDRIEIVSRDNGETWSATNDSVSVQGYETPAAALAALDAVPTDEVEAEIRSHAY